MIVDHFNKYIVTGPTPKNKSHHDVKYLFHHWISKFGPTQNLFTDRRSEYPNSEVVKCCTLFIIRHSPTTSHAAGTNGLVEVQNEILGTHLRSIFLYTPNIQSNQVYFFADGYNTQTLSQLHLSPDEIIFHTQSCIPLKLLFLIRNSFRECTAKFCSDLFPHSHYQ